ncbi:MAG: DUF2911 domain-containing protein [Opitutae bacterium]|nr:DUF2911 domain-containing protein [Opitutae bacterium]
MKHLRSTLLALAFALGAAALPAQPAAPAATAAVPAPAAPEPRTSPHETITGFIGDTQVVVIYGRPYSKNPRTGAMRKIWGGLVPYGRLWRAGADEATLFITRQPLRLGGTLVPAGAYSLFLLPAVDGSARLILNREIGQYGSDPYDLKKEFARIDLHRDPLATSVDQFTIAVEESPGTGGGVLKFAWELTQFSVPFTVQK